MKKETRKARKEGVRSKKLEYIAKEKERNIGNCINLIRIQAREAERLDEKKKAHRQAPSPATPLPCQSHARIHTPLQHLPLRPPAPMTPLRHIRRNLTNAITRHNRLIELATPPRPPRARSRLRPLSRRAMGGRRGLALARRPAGIVARVKVHFVKVDRAGAVHDGCGERDVVRGGRAVRFDGLGGTEGGWRRAVFGGVVAPGTAARAAVVAAGRDAVAAAGCAAVYGRGERNVAGGLS